MSKLIVGWLMAFVFFCGLSLTYLICRLVNRIGAAAIHWFGKLAFGLGLVWIDVGLWIIIGSFVVVLLDLFLNGGE